MNPNSVAAPPRCVTLRGPVALSPFRLEKLHTNLVSMGVPVGHIRAEYLHIVASNLELSAASMSTLQQLLTYGVNVDVPAINGSIAPPILVFPRFGTISPWSSKATDIAHNCGLQTVVRIERATSFTIDGFAALTPTQRELVLAAIHFWFWQPDMLLPPRGPRRCG